VLHLIASGSRSNKCPAQYEDDASDRETNNQRQTDFHQNGLPPKVPNNLNNRTSKMRRPQEKPAGVTRAALSLNLHKDLQREIDAAGMRPPGFYAEHDLPAPDENSDAVPTKDEERGGFKATSGKSADLRLLLGNFTFRLVR
jgi:hypothetical protein